MCDEHRKIINTATHRAAWSLPEAGLIHVVRYREGLKNEKLKKDVEKMLAINVMESAQTEWASPIVCVPKKDEPLQFYVDYLKRNATTTRDSYPLPRLDDWNDCLGDATIFSTLDANNGFWQIAVHKSDCEKRALAPHHRLYKYLRIPFRFHHDSLSFIDLCTLYCPQSGGHKIVYI